MTAQAAHNDPPRSQAAGALRQPDLPDYMVWWSEAARDEQAPAEGRRLPQENVSAERRISILIVDDERSIAELLAELLEGAGYDVFIASNGRTALAIARREHPALILTDLMMPGVNGVEFVRKLRASPVTHDIPVVMMSSIRPNLEALDNVPFLPKPFDLDDVLAAVETYASEEEIHREWMA